MTKNKPNSIKLNIIATILTLICISYTVNPTNPKVNSRTDIKENFRDFENESENLKSLKQQLKEETTASKLEAIGKKLEAQKIEETTKIANIASAQADFIETLDNKIQPEYFKKEKEEAKKNVKMQIKRMIYSSLNYDTTKIKNLKDILYSIIDKDEGKHKNIALKFFYKTTTDIQAHLENHLQLIQTKSNSLTPKELEELLIRSESSLKLKEKFAKQLIKTVEEMKTHPALIATDYPVDGIALHIMDNYNYTIDEIIKYNQKELNK
ncbi:complement regulator-acquiring protein [Borreliella bissettiae]|uniref:complement regulator-acquiring protein n=1 Tax=Borrelia bissettiae TaxID=64897 RepID=UPI00264A12D2|nr:complement regulator-acquiring protein [Borreliella bissettiae]WKD00369.1 complement regulator-acquiring protein [Borreliella bissettiae]